VKEGTKAWWKEAAMQLARCCVTTIQTGGKLGMGSGLLIGKKDGKTVVRRWDEEHLAALKFIGIEFEDAPKKRKRR
jgi:hypothetical protein